jgi:hypothetical protein
MLYRKGRFPEVQTAEELRKVTEEEFGKIETAFSEGTELQLVPLGAPPLKPRNGMIVYADGATWNPGAGEGFYGRVSGLWVKL